MKKIPRVVILCGGMGTTLREETEYKPKSLVEIGGNNSMAYYENLQLLWI